MPWREISFHAHLAMVPWCPPFVHGHPGVVPFLRPGHEPSFYGPGQEGQQTCFQRLEVTSCIDLGDHCGFEAWVHTAEGQYLPELTRILRKYLKQIENSHQ